MHEIQDGGRSSGGVLAKNSSPREERMPDLELLQTEHCHLCELAFDVLMSVPALSGRQLQTVDIVQVPHLFDAFAEKIPLLRCGEVQLAWPFTADEVADWLAALA